MPEGKKPHLPDADVHLPADPVFHFAQEHKLDYKRHYSIRTLILLFFAFSIAGWLWEVTLHIVTKGMLVNRGTMLGPWLPIYGAGGALVLFLLKKLFTRPVATFFRLHGAVLGHRVFHQLVSGIHQGHPLVGLQRLLYEPSTAASVWRARSSSVSRAARWCTLPARCSAG